MGEDWENLAKQLRGMSDHICLNNAVIDNNCDYSSAGWTSVSEPQRERDRNRSKTDTSLKNQYRFKSE